MSKLKWAHQWFKTSCHILLIGAFFIQTLPSNFQSFWTLSSVELWVCSNFESVRASSLFKLRVCSNFESVRTSSSFELKFTAGVSLVSGKKKRNWRIMQKSKSTFFILKIIIRSFSHHRKPKKKNRFVFPFFVGF